MTNVLAIWLGLIVVVIFGVDWFFFDWAFAVSVMKRLMQLINYLAIWR